MKIALITDTHFGVRNDSLTFLDNTKKFLDTVFFPYIDEHKITTVVHLGDLVDRRKFININTAKRLREDFLDKISERNLDYHQILGNHDTYFKNTNSVNAIRELFKDKNFKVYETATEVEFDGTKVLFVPWICDDNREYSLNLIKETNAQICMGHLEISGFEMYKGSMVSHGDDRKIFDSFDIVMSGHFHHRSTDGSIFYLGSHGEFTWSDYDDARGFHVFDIFSRQLSFVENPYKVFKKVWYNDAEEKFLETAVDYSSFKDAMVKVIVQNKNNIYWFEQFIDHIENEKPMDIQIVEDHLNLNIEDDDDIVKEAESTLDIFSKYIDNSESKNIDKDKLKKRIFDLYNEALSVE